MLPHSYKNKVVSASLFKSVNHCLFEKKINNAETNKTAGSEALTSS